MNNKDKASKISQKNSFNIPSQERKIAQDNLSGLKNGNLQLSIRRQNSKTRHQRIPTENITYKSNSLRNQQQNYHHHSLKKMDIFLKQNQKDKSTQNKSKLMQLQKQKTIIQQQIKHLDKQIIKISKRGYQSVFKQRQKVYQDKQAKQNAIKLIKTIKAQKRQFQQKKQKRMQKLKQELKANYQQFQKIKKQKQQQKRQKKRNLIQQKMNDKIMKQLMHKQYERQSNKLVMSMIKEQQQVKEQELHDQIVMLQRDNQQHREYSRQSFINFKDIERHQQQYLKQREEFMKNKSIIAPFDYPMKKYSKNRWATKLEQIELKQKQQQKLKQIQRQNRIQNMKRYGQKMSKVIMIKKRVRTVMQGDRKDKGDDKLKLTQTYQKTAQKSPNKLQSSPSNNNFSQQKNSYIKEQLAKKISMPKSKLFDQIREPRQSEQHKQKMAQLRKETLKRLKMYSSKSPQPDYQSKYENYLGSLNLKKPEQSKRIEMILKDSNLSSEQQNYKILNRAMALESRAKIHEQFKTINKDQVTNLYINSIQAKLILMQKLQIN